MKKAPIVSILILVVLATFTSCSHNYVRVSGRVYGPLIKYNHIQVVVNDTIEKYRKAKGLSLKNAKEYMQLLENKKWVQKLDNGGRFRFRLRKTDSIHIYAYQFQKQSFIASELTKIKPQIILEASPCKEYVACNDSPELFVFIGKRIQVQADGYPYYCDRTLIPFDHRFMAKYEVLNNVHEQLPTDQIEFEVYDHYGSPAFAKTDLVMLYVLKFCDRYIHLKYQYERVVKTEDGTWLVPLKPWAYKYLDSIPEIRPVRINADRNLSTSIYPSISSDSLKKWYPQPYYEVENFKVISNYGITPSDMLLLGKRTFLSDYMKSD